MERQIIKPDYIFEVSWEICNKVGGIHTVISTKSVELKERCNKKLILIGPDVWRENKEHPEFIEDKDLFVNWKISATAEGLRCRTGYWDIPGKPFVILVDFTHYINQKDEIFFKFWEQYRLDSLSGQWDYIEPALFGYATAKIIESFTNFYTSVHDKVIAHFNEWMTGTGILYLKEAMPQIGTAFTTHATTVGRSLAGNSWPLYNRLTEYNGDLLAREFNIASKQSLEKLSAHNADVFTTVSDITAEECKQLLSKPVDIVTQNGFENDFVPKGDLFFEKRTNARNKFVEIAENLLDIKYQNQPFIIASSGRYEFLNKGYDLFIDALGEINKNPDNDKEILAYILVPANNYGYKTALYNKLTNTNGENVIDDKHLTHNLHEAEHDPILNRIKYNNLLNRPEDKVKIIFVPSYLNGDDGIFNMPYYDLLIGLDLSVFVSYYEPWGYTPLESVAFGVPTITTTLAGFGKWMESVLDKDDDSVVVINRDDYNSDYVVEELIKSISRYVTMDQNYRDKLIEKCIRASEHALWKNLVDKYSHAFTIAFEKVEARKDRIVRVSSPVQQSHSVVTKSKKPLWRKIEVKTVMPDKFKGLVEISLNQWWTWNYKAIELFKYIDRDLWRKKAYNPITLLEDVSLAKMKELENDEVFVKKYNEVYAAFCNYMEKAKDKKAPKVAYFSMEYGISDGIKIFSGGLGVLAGDYLKEASETNSDIVGIGLLYRYGYFKQIISVYGDQRAEYLPQDFDKMPLIPVRNQDDSHKKVMVRFPGRDVFAKVWRVNVGRIPLYLLDTDTEENQEHDKLITSQLYGGDLEFRFKQEMILGIGGIRALQAMDIKPDVYHCNEGHSAFIGLERLRVLRTKRSLNFNQALEIIRASTLFTTHTPVPAGHDKFDEDMMRVYMSHYPERLKISWEELMQLGRINPNEKFSMSYLAANMSQEVNGVSKLHGQVSQKMFAELWQGYFPEESHLGYVTNGVHYQTWTAKDWKKLYENEFGEKFLEDTSDKKIWAKIHHVENDKIWTIRQKQRKKLIEYVKERVRKNWVMRYENPKNIVEIINRLDENVLTIGFARRFATYKRADLLFRNLDRLATILNNPEMPVQILFAGKAHPNDKAGQDLIKRIVDISKREEFIGKIIFIDDYDMELAKKLVQGVDVWLNTPTRPQEASGTSGMKAVMNGVLNFSVLDGWWVEGYKENAGWSLPLERHYQDQEFQNELDAGTMYTIIENEIAPLYYNKDKNGIPNGWIEYIKKCIAEIAPEFTTKRMIDDYYRKFYNKLHQRSITLKENYYEKALKIAEWKRNIKRAWQNIEVLRVEFPDYENNPVQLSQSFLGEIEIDLKGLTTDDISVEVVVITHNDAGEESIYAKYKAELVSTEDKIAKYRVEGSPQKPGFYDYAVRIFATNELLPYPQDSGLIKWV